MIIAMVVARASGGVIGFNNTMPWHLPADLKYFKNLTMGHQLIMGRKTFESIGKPLPGRSTLVVSRQADFAPPGCTVAHSVEEALAFCREKGLEKVFVVGGGQVYQQVLPLANEIYLTEIDAKVAGDAWFTYEATEWEEVYAKPQSPDERNKYHYTFKLLRRNSK